MVEDLTIKKIESKSSRQGAFIKRRDCLIKKARELATLCDSEVAVIVHSDDGELFEFASSSMEQILTRFKECRRIKEGIPVNHDPEREGDVLREEEMEKLKQNDQQHVLGRDLKSMSRQDLLELEKQLNKRLLCIKDRKAAILVQELEQSRVQNQQSIQENETLRRKVENLETLCASTSYQQPLCVEYQLMEVTNFAPGQGANDPQMACSTSTGYANLVDSTLQLGPSTSKVCGKRKTPHEGRSNDDTFLSL